MLFQIYPGFLLLLIQETHSIRSKREHLRKNRMLSLFHAIKFLGKKKVVCLTSQVWLIKCISISTGFSVNSQTRIMGCGPNVTSCLLWTSFYQDKAIPFIYTLSISPLELKSCCRNCMSTMPKIVTVLPFTDINI